MKIMEDSLRIVAEEGLRGSTTMTDPVHDHLNTLQFCKVKNELRDIWLRARENCAVPIFGLGYPQSEASTYESIKFAEARKDKGFEVWFYSNEALLGADRRLARMFYGLYGWRLKLGGMTSWTYNDAPTVQWEMVREGVDDAKYLDLLEASLEKAGRSHPASAAARKFPKELAGHVHLDKHGNFAGYRVKVKQTLTPADFDAMRLGAAQIIASLLGRKAPRVAGKSSSGRVAANDPLAPFAKALVSRRASTPPPRRRRSCGAWA